jgi:hypothetical protein
LSLLEIESMLSGYRWIQRNDVVQDFIRRRNPRPTRVGSFRENPAQRSARWRPPQLRELILFATDEPRMVNRSITERCLLAKTERGYTFSWPRAFGSELKSRDVIECLCFAVVFRQR